MAEKQYSVHLIEEERTCLLEMTHKGKLSARKLARCHILLRADEGATDFAIAESLHLSIRTVERTRKRFAEAGLEAALTDRPRPGGKRKLDGKQEAFLVALACTDTPDGQEHWTMQLLADRLVQLEVVDEISDETVRRVLKRGRSNLG
jgi:transposase